MGPLFVKCQIRKRLYPVNSQGRGVFQLKFNKQKTTDDEQPQKIIKVNLIYLLSFHIPLVITSG